MNILLSGSEGFLGKNLSRLLPPAHAIIPFDPKFGDDMVDFERVRRKMKGVDAALMFGSRAVGRRNMEKRPDAMEIDTAGARNFAEAALENGVPLIFASSIRVYGSDEEMKGGEVEATHPADSYGEMKLECERILAEYEKRGLRYVILRMAAVYGPGMPEDFVMSYLFSRIAKGEPVVLKSDARTKRNFIFVEDVASAIDAILSWGFPSSEIFNIASEEPVTLPELAAHISKIVPKPCTILDTGTQKGISEELIPTQKIRSKTGWRPATLLEKGLKKTYAYSNARI